VYFGIVVVVGLCLKLNFLQFAFAFFGIPSIYFAVNLKGYGKKIEIEATILGFFMVFVFDLIAHSSNSWYVPGVLGMRVLGKFPIDEFVFAFFYLFAIFTLYGTFFDKSKIKKISKSFKKLVYFGSFLLLLVLILHTVSPQLLEVPYFYLFMIMIFLITTAVGFACYPKIAGKISLLSTYLFLPAIAYELVALELGHWYFEKGYHIGYVNILNYSFPLEELFFFPLAVTSILVLHEAFGDNKR